MLQPYVGLRPFREADGPFFFGRERDIRTIASCLLSSSLSVLYGPSGVGKSSVLQAGVVPYIRQHPIGGILYFNEWQDNSFRSLLNRKCRESLVGPPESDLENVFRPPQGPFYLILDQFEEYLLYDHSSVQEEFESMLARLVNRDDGRTRILIGIREDALFRLDQRLSLRIPNLLENTLQLRHLNVTTAREAIEKPIEVFNRVSTGSGAIAIEPVLVNALLEEMQAGDAVAGEQETITATGRSQRHAPSSHIETAFLQLVLNRIWVETRARNSDTLSLATLRDLGGALTIVNSHVKNVLDKLSDTQQNIAARLFGYLVTPSRSKIAQSAGDLVAFGEASANDVMAVLSALTDQPDARILRRLTSPERYELFHDVLAQPILDWRRARLEALRKAEELREQEAELNRQRSEVRRLRVFAACLLVLTLIAGYAAIFGFQQKRKADSSAAAAKRSAAAANEAEARVQVSLKQLEAANARAKGDAEKAKDLETQANSFRQIAEDQQNKAAGASNSVTALLAKVNSLTKELEDEKAHRADDETQLRNVQGQLTKAQSDSATLRSQLDEAKKAQTSVVPAAASDHPAIVGNSDRAVTKSPSPVGAVVSNSDRPVAKLNVPAALTGKWTGLINGKTATLSIQSASGDVTGDLAYTTNTSLPVVEKMRVAVNGFKVTLTGTSYRYQVRTKAVFYLDMIGAEISTDGARLSGTKYDQEGHTSNVTFTKAP